MAVGCRDVNVVAPTVCENVSPVLWSVPVNTLGEVLISKFGARLDAVLVPNGTKLTAVLDGANGTRTVGWGLKNGFDWITIFWTTPVPNRSPMRLGAVDCGEVAAVVGLLGVKVGGAVCGAVCGDGCVDG
jgi:hypothetical protein